MSRKGLERRSGGYREHIEGWTCDYYKTGDWWAVNIWRGRGVIQYAAVRTLGAARAAARAVVMERETRGLERVGGDTSFYTPDRAACFAQESEGWFWACLEQMHTGTAPTLAEARKAALECVCDVQHESAV